MQHLVEHILEALEPGATVVMKCLSDIMVLGVLWGDKDEVHDVTCDIAKLLATATRQRLVCPKSSGHMD